MGAFWYPKYWPFRAHLFRRLSSGVGPALRPPRLPDCLASVAMTVSVSARSYCIIVDKLLYCCYTIWRTMNGLRQLREQRMMTQREVAERADITVTALSRIENGRVRPSLRTIRSLASAFQLSPQEMRQVIASGQLPFA